MRKTLIDARKRANLKQKNLAKKIGISTRTYQYIEKGELVGKVDMWDTLEDLFQIPQRKLRELEQKPDGNPAEEPLQQNNSTKKQ